MSASPPPTAARLGLLATQGGDGRRENGFGQRTGLAGDAQRRLDLLLAGLGLGDAGLRLGELGIGLGQLLLRHELRAGAEQAVAAAEVLHPLLGIADPAAQFIEAVGERLRGAAGRVGPGRGLAGGR